MQMIIPKREETVLAAQQLPRLSCKFELTKNRRFYEGKNPSIICLFLFAALTDARLSVFLRGNSYSCSSHCEDMLMYQSPI